MRKHAYDPRVFAQQHMDLAPAHAVSLIPRDHQGRPLTRLQAYRDNDPMVVDIMEPGSRRLSIPLVDFIDERRNYSSGYRGLLHEVLTPYGAFIRNRLG